MRVTIFHVTAEGARSEHYWNAVYASNVTNKVKDTALRTMVQLDYYTKVAVVEAASFADAVRATTHAEDCWSKNPEVLECTGPDRSSNAGDILVVGSRAFVITVTGGFKEVSESIGLVLLRYNSEN